MDLDSTLLDDNKEIPSHTAHVIRQCKDAGIRIAIATMRSFSSANERLKDVCVDALIVNGGADAYVAGMCTYRAHIPAKYVVRYIKECLANDLKVKIVGKTKSVTNIAHPAYHRESFNYTCVDLHTFVESAAKITFYAKNGYPMDTLNSIYRNGAMCFIDPQKSIFSHSSATKLNAVCSVLAYYDIGFQDVMAFGDDVSDLPLLVDAGYGIAVSNASDAVIQVADAVCATNHEEGVAQYLKTYIL